MAPGDGENITVQVLSSSGSRAAPALRLGAGVVVEATGLRKPCLQLDRFQRGLMKAVLDRDEHGRLIRKAGIRRVVLTGGLVRCHDRVRVGLPPRPHVELRPV